MVWVLLPILAYLAVCLLEPKAPQGPLEESRSPGVRLFYRYECGRCHSLSRLTGALGKMGPPLDHIGTLAGQRRPGVTAHDYLRESLVKPQAFVVEGYLKTMPAFDQLPAVELDELVVYLENLK